VFPEDLDADDDDGDARHLPRAGCELHVGLHLDWCVLARRAAPRERFLSLDGHALGRWDYLVPGEWDSVIRLGAPRAISITLNAFRSHFLRTSSLPYDIKLELSTS